MSPHQKLIVQFMCIICTPKFWAEKSASYTQIIAVYLSFYIKKIKIIKISINFIFATVLFF